ncbi:MAG: LLM class F420-dependent oxidoreductase [Actinomycetota bacterium]|nr:LLM class F420-dependent oxidoreductase [Actinomycetota bacterium]
MRIGIFGGEAADGTVDDLIEAARRTEADGFDSFWLPQIFGPDAITVQAIIGREVPRIELGTAVVPTYPRHPMMLASQALTTQAASGGRFTLGIGLSHQLVIESMFGMSFDKPVRHMREYLSILLPLIREGSVSFTGETLSASGTVSVGGSTPCPVLVAALGPKMLELAGSQTDGTITWMTGPDTLANHIVPSITAAAAAAGRNAPRIAASLPVAVTDEPDATRARASKLFEIYGMLPSYRAMLDREGAAGPADVALVGDEAAVRDGIDQVRQAGVTDFVATEFAVDAPERTRTRDLLKSLV